MVFHGQKGYCSEPVWKRARYLVVDDASRKYYVMIKTVMFFPEIVFDYCVLRDILKQN